MILMMLHVYIIHGHAFIYLELGRTWSSDVLVKRGTMTVSRSEMDTVQRVNRDMEKLVTYL